MFINSENLSKKQKITQKTLILLIALTLTFIFLQSTLPKEIASKESLAVSGAILGIIPSDSPIGRFIAGNMDTIAHFAEFGILGFFVSLYISFFSQSYKMPILLSLFFAETVAIIDETIQIFSGRTPDIKDVWADVFGFITVSLITYIAYFCYKRVKNKKETSNG